MYNNIKSGVERIKKDWLFILENILAFRNLVDETLTNFKELPECLILAQKLSIWFDYFKAKYQIPNKAISEKEYISKKKERDILYQRLYKIFDELKINEIVNYISQAFFDTFTKYKVYISSLDKLSKNEFLMMLNLRDNLKILYEELKIWQGKWRGEGEKNFCDIDDNISQELFTLDNLLREYYKKNIDKLKWINEEAENYLIPKESNFWWWRGNK